MCRNVSVPCVMPPSVCQSLISGPLPAAKQCAAAEAHGHGAAAADGRDATLLDGFGFVLREQEGRGAHCLAAGRGPEIKD